MYGSLDVRKFLLQQGESLSRSSAVPGPREGDSPRISQEKIHRARIAVARGAHDAEDCRMLLDMLGLTPDEDGTPPAAR
ncbi:hypothetical protein GCM10027174_37550 [Salinifilum aidingensis]